MLTTIKNWLFSPKPVEAPNKGLLWMLDCAIRYGQALDIGTDPSFNDRLGFWDLAVYRSGWHAATVSDIANQLMFLGFHPVTVHGERVMWDGDVTIRITGDVFLKQNTESVTLSMEFKNKFKKPRTHTIYAKDGRYSNDGLGEFLQWAK